MKCRSYRRMVAISVSALMMLPALGSAQTPITPVNGIERFLDYLQQDIFIEPGIGLKKVGVGTSFDTVLATWGEPNKKRTRVLTGPRREWLYIVDSATSIIVSGNSNVTTLSFRGGLTTPFTTVEGAKFGMAPYEISSLYGQSPDQSATGLGYPHRGVYFGFENGRLNVISVAAPQTQS